MDSKIDKVSSNYIPDDVSFVILSKLPLKSLKRFTFACKSWSLLFENPNFMKMFCKRFMSMHQSLYHDTHLFLNIKRRLSDPQGCSTLCLLSNENKVTMKWPQEYVYTHLLDSGINEILCFSDVYRECLKLYNPSTSEFVIVPPSPAQFLLFNDVWFDVHGYGYDDVNGDYKILRHVKVILYKPNENVDWNYLPLTPHPFWEIYSLKNNSWKRLEDLDMPESIGCKVYLNGMCHWCANAETYMISFNLSNEVFFTTHFSVDMQDNYLNNLVKRESNLAGSPKIYFDLVVLNGFVAMISKQVNASSFHIYVLGELGVKESWSKLLVIESLPDVERPIGVGIKGDIFFTKYDNKLAIYHLNTQIIEDLSVEEEPLCRGFAILKSNLLPIRRIWN